MKTLEEAIKVIEGLQAEIETLKKEPPKSWNDTLNKAAKPIVTRLFDAERETVVKAIVEEVGSNPDLRKALAGDGKGGEGQGDPKPDPRMTKLEKELSDMREKERRARAKEAIEAGLRKHGIEASPLLVRSFLADAKEEADGFLLGDAPMEDALAAFAKSDDGKRFIPAKPGGGTGARPGNNADASGGKSGAIDWQGLGEAMATHR